MAPSKRGQLGNEAKNKRGAKVGFVGTNHQLGINAWREKGFHSPGKRTARRKGLSLCSSPGEPWDPSFTSPGLGGIINADQSCVPYV